MSLAYFDTNIFDHLAKRKRGVSEEDGSRLGDAVSSRRLSVIVGHVTIRESLAALRSDPESAKAHFGLIESLADWDRFVRFSTPILEEDIRHFAYNGERANTPFETSRN